MLLAITMKPRAKLVPEGLDDVRKWPRGSTFPAPVFVERLEGFTGPVLLEQTAYQQRSRQGMTGPDLVVPPGVGKIDYPIYTIEIPSTKQKARFRPFLVKEEKLLLMAKESENSADILTAVKQIVNNCAIDPNFDVDKLAVFDLELIFIKLRAFSVDNIIKVAYKDLEDEKIYNFDIKLDEVSVIFPENNEKNYEWQLKNSNNKNTSRSFIYLYGVELSRGSVGSY